MKIEIHVGARLVSELYVKNSIGMGEVSPLASSRHHETFRMMCDQLADEFRDMPEGMVASLSILKDGTDDRVIHSLCGKDCTRNIP